MCSNFPNCLKNFEHLMCFNDDSLCYIGLCSLSLILPIRSTSSHSFSFYFLFLLLKKLVTGKDAHMFHFADYILMVSLNLFLCLCVSYTAVVSVGICASLES